MRLLQYEKLQEVVSVISGLSIKLLSASTAFCNRTHHYFFAHCFRDIGRKAIFAVCRSVSHLLINALELLELVQILYTLNLVTR